MGNYSKKSTTVWIPLDREKCEAVYFLVNQIENDFVDDLNEKEQSFINDLQHNIPKYRRVSQGQWDWFSKIYKKLLGSEVPLEIQEKPKKGDDIDF